MPTMSGSSYVEEAARRFRWVVTSFVLMVNHFHLVIETREPNLARGMQWRNGSYACYCNKRHRTVGHLFGERYKSGPHRDRGVQEASGEIVLSPVRARVVERPENFRGRANGRPRVSRRHPSGCASRADAVLW
jgi:putative transposase